MKQLFILLTALTCALALPLYASPEILKKTKLPAHQRPKKERVPFCSPPQPAPMSEQPPMDLFTINRRKFEGWLAYQASEHRKQGVTPTQSNHILKTMASQYVWLEPEHRADWEAPAKWGTKEAIPPLLAYLPKDLKAVLLNSNAQLPQPKKEAMKRIVVAFIMQQEDTTDLSNARSLYQAMTAPEQRKLFLQTVTDSTD